MDANEMLKIIHEQIDIWDKWTYDTDDKCFVFFTLSDCYEIRENITYYRYKAKEWKWCERSCANKILGWLTEEEFSTFTSHSHTWEYEEVG